jgi:hypothetical protein
MMIDLLQRRPASANVWIEVCLRPTPVRDRHSIRGIEPERHGTDLSGTDGRCYGFDAWSSSKEGGNFGDVIGQPVGAVGFWIEREDYLVAGYSSHLRETGPWVWPVMNGQNGQSGIE